MDNIVKEARPEADERFDTARIATAVTALATEHAGREDVFRAAVAKLLKAEMLEARATAQAVLLKDRHGRRCAERLCFVQDEIIRILFDAATRHLYHSPIPSGARSSLFFANSFRRRTDGGGGDRRLWPRADGAGIRHRSSLYPALQADRLGRAGRRSHSLLPVGHGAEGRPCDALGR